MNKQAEDYFFTWFDNFEKRLRVIGERLDDHDKKIDYCDKKIAEIKKLIEERKK